jgi:phage-related holin
LFSAATLIVVCISVATETCLLSHYYVTDNAIMFFLQDVNILFLSTAEGSGLSAKQKRLVEMLEELKSMRETRR